MVQLMKAVHPKKILSNCIFICWLIVGAQTPCFMKTESTFVLLCILIDQILVHRPKSKVRRRSQDPLSKPSPNYFKEKPKSKSCCSPVDRIQNVLGPNKCNGGRAVPERPMQMVEEFLKKKNGGAVEKPRIQQSDRNNQCKFLQITCGQAQGTK